MSEAADELKEENAEEQIEPEVEPSDAVEPPAETDADDQAVQADAANDADDQIAQSDDEAEVEAEAAGLSEAADEEASAEAPEQSPVHGAEEQEQDGPSTADFVIVTICAVILGLLLCLPTLLGSSSSASTDYDLSNGVAANVNGVEIGENDATSFITSFRTTQGFEDEAVWGQWLVNNGYTPETMRSSVIEYLTTRELIVQAAKEQGIEISESDVDAQVADVAEQVGGEEALNEALAMQGMTIESYRESIYWGLLQDGLINKVIADDESVSDEAVLEMMKMYFPDDVPEDTETLEGLDPSLVDSVRSWLEQQAYSEWMDQYREKSTITVNDMPEGLPYDVDISGYEMTTNDLAELTDASEPEGEPQDGEETGK